MSKKREMLYCLGCGRPHAKDEYEIVREYDDGTILGFCPRCGSKMYEWCDRWDKCDACGRRDECDNRKFAEYTAGGSR